MKRLALLLLFAATACGSSAIPHPAPTATPATGGLGAGASGTGSAFQGAPSPLYATTSAGYYYFPAGSNGNSTNGTFTGDTQITAIAVEANTGNIAVADGTGLETPEGDITTNVDVLNAESIALDANDNLYAINPIVPVVYIWGPAANGNATPTAEIRGPFFSNADSCTNGIAVDRSANVYVSVTSLSSAYFMHTCVDAIFVFAAGTTGSTVTPTAIISGSNTGLDGIAGIAYGQKGIYVADLSSNAVTIYPVSANGDVAPLSTISGSNTMLSNPTAITVDAQGYIYVANASPASGDYITIFPPNASGNVAPSWTIGGLSAPITSMAAYNSALLPAAKRRVL